MNIIKKSLYGVCCILATPAFLVSYIIYDFRERKHLNKTICYTLKEVISTQEYMGSLDKNTLTYKDLKDTQRRRLNGVVHLLEQRGNRLDLEIASKIKSNFNGWYYNENDVVYLNKLL